MYLLALRYDTVHIAKRFETGTPDRNFQGASWPKNVKDKTSRGGAIIMERKQEADLFTMKEK